MIRMSSLPIVQFCPRAPELDLGAQRRAAVSSAFHALASGHPDAAAMIARLSDKERKDCLSRKIPTTLELFGLQLEYRDAKVEFEVALRADGTLPGFGEDAAFVGHPDMAWIVQIEKDGIKLKVAVVPDMKATRYTSTPDSLQLHAYGHAVALEEGCHAYWTGIWTTDEGEWIPGELFLLGSPEHEKFLGTLRAIASNESKEYSTGSHCFGCYSRLRCPMHLVHRDDALPSVPGTGEPELKNNDEALDLLMWKKRLEDTAEALGEYLKAYAYSVEPIADGKGKVWGEVWFKGKESAPTVGELRQALGEDAEKLIRRGVDYPQFRWTNARAKD